MRAPERAIARKSLDKRLISLTNADAFARPTRGWIKAIREALGMTTAQLAKRLGVAQPTVIGLEGAEASKAISLKTLERAARALDCTLVYVLVPGNRLKASCRNGPTRQRASAFTRSVTAWRSKTSACPKTASAHSSSVLRKN